MKFYTILAVSVLVLSGCTTTQNHINAVSTEGENLTVASVQRNIKEGMSSAEVVSILGSPNMVTTDEERREVWVYDKVSTVSAHSSGSASGGLAAGALGGVAGVLGGFGGSKSAGATSTTQKTLTIIIKFDKNNKVYDYSYRTSKF